MIAEGTAVICRVPRLGVHILHFIDFKCSIKCSKLMKLWSKTVKRYISLHSFCQANQNKTTLSTSPILFYLYPSEVPCLPCPIFVPLLLLISSVCHQWLITSIFYLCIDITFHLCLAIGCETYQIVYVDLFIDVINLCAMFTAITFKRWIILPIYLLEAFDS